MTYTKIDQARGILNPRLGARNFRLARYAPSDALSFFIERYWIIQWDLCGQAPYLSQSLPYPCVNVVLERGKSAVFGVVTGKFDRLLEGQGQVFGIKFKPGGFYPFMQSPLVALTNNAIPLEAVFGESAGNLEDHILSQPSHENMIGLMEAFMCQHLPEPDEQIARINRLVDEIIANPAITQVDDLLAYTPMSKRSLQRLFHDYVGVSPKWVIKRYRLHEAADRLAEGVVPNWAKLAASLGYFDQAHFIKDFKMIVGLTPQEYARNTAIQF